MPEGHYLKVEKSARYYLSGSLDREYRAVCFVLHGYGQLARYFIRPFEQDQLETILFIAPEGLHRFYLEGTSGRVGASWMTREDRLKDIEDYCRYLDRLYQEIIPQIKLTEDGKKGILGFSQGVATACRWLSFSLVRFDFLVNYAGIYPPDLPETQAISKMQQIPVKHLLGSEDEYITQNRMKESLTEFSKKGYPSELRLFEGRHKVYPEVLENVFTDLGILA